MSLSALKKSSFWMLVLTFITLFALYSLEYVLQLEPCPLCIMQRLCGIGLAFLCLGYFLSSSCARSKYYLGLQGLLIFLGGLFALRQLYLQLYAPVDGSLCLPGFEALLQYFSWDIILKSLFWGSNDCATVAWRLLGMPLSAWAIVYFFTMFFLWIWHLRQVIKS